MGVMKVDKDLCASCGLCIRNCPLRAWEMLEGYKNKMGKE